MANIKRNIFAFHTSPQQLVGYNYDEMIPTILMDKIKHIRSNEEMIDTMEQSRDILGKDLDIALYTAELYKNSESRNFWPVGGKVEMALLNSPKHREQHLKYHIASQLQKDPRYIDVLRQLDPNFVARYLGYLISQSYHVDADFKRTVLEMLSNNITASLLFAARSMVRNPYAERKLMRMSEDDWQGLTATDPALSSIGGTRFYRRAWDYYTNCLAQQEAAAARSDAHAAGFDI